MAIFNPEGKTMKYEVI